MLQSDSAATTISTSGSSTTRSDTRFAVDVAVVGGGPAGLAAALYLARFLRSIVVFDAGDARAKLIPKTNNCPGFPDGIAGTELLDRLRRQTADYDVNIIDGCVSSAVKAENGLFLLSTTAGIVEASTVILATGIVDKAPAIARLREGIAKGAIRLCPVCDAYEAKGKRVGIVGAQQAALKEAVFLKAYTSSVSMLFNYPQDVSQSLREQAAAAGVEIWDSVDDLTLCDDGVDVVMADGSTKRHIDVVYTAMGCDVRSELAYALGAELDEEGHVLVGADLETCVSGLYAIGDVARALNQIAVGFGHAALAATHIHKYLRR